MTLLEATSCMIDFTKTHGRDNDRLLQCSIRRMSLRLKVLQERADRSRLRRQKKGWADVIMLQGASICNFCEFDYSFQEFCKVAELNRKGDVIRFDCPACGKCLVFLMEWGANCSAYMVGVQAQERATLKDSGMKPT